MTRQELGLLALQSLMKRDPLGYQDELLLQLRHFHACLSIFQLSSSLKSSSACANDRSAAKELAEMSMFLAHLMPSFPQHLREFPQQLLLLLQSKAASLQPLLRRQLTQALILLRNRQMIELVDILPVLMELQTLGDRALRKLAFLHIVHDIRRMNLKHKNETKNRALQNLLFLQLQEDEETTAKRALVVLCDLHRRNVWVDERIANAICAACFHKSSKILKAALCYLVGYEQLDEDEDGDGYSSDDDNEHTPVVTLSREVVYKAYHKGTVSSRKKKQARLQRVMRSLKKQQRAHLHEANWNSYLPLQHLHDPQGFAEKLFSRLQMCNECFEVKLLMMKVISRAVGLHRLILLNFYPFLQKYLQPHQRDVTQLLAAAVQSCHEMVPPDAVESLLQQLVNQFVHDRARPEVIAVGLNAVREMCIRIPLMMTSELLQDLALYKKSHEKAVSSASRSIICLYRQVCPSLLEKKDRGRNADVSAHPKAFGETIVLSGVPGADLLEAEMVESLDTDNNGVLSTDRNFGHPLSEDGFEIASTKEEEEVGDLEAHDSEEDENEHPAVERESAEVGTPITEDDSDSDKDSLNENYLVADEDGQANREEDSMALVVPEGGWRKRRKVAVIDTDYSHTSTCSLKKLAATEKSEHIQSDRDDKVVWDGDGILTNEDFQRIRNFQAMQAAKAALAEHGMGKVHKRRNEEYTKIPSSEYVSEGRVDPATLEPKIYKHREKEERIASVQAGREDRLPYAARTAVKQKKTGGLSNRQKEKRKGMPLAALRAKIARSHGRKRSMKKRKKQFSGKKAWK